jgi:hypothetical protein
MPPEAAARTRPLPPPVNDGQWQDRRALCDHFCHELSQPLTSLGLALELALGRPPDALRDRADLERAFAIARELTARLHGLRELVLRDLPAEAQAKKI